MKRKTLALLLAVLALICFALPALAASNITNAIYSGDITVHNGDSSLNFTNVAGAFANSTANMITSGFLNATASDAAIRLNGTDVKFMPGWSTNPWMVYIPSISVNQTLNYKLYSSGVTGGSYGYYFPGAGGMTAANSATINPLSTSWEYEFKGYFDMSGDAYGYLIRSDYDPLMTYIRVDTMTTGTIIFTVANGGTSTVTVNGVTSGEHTLKIGRNGANYYINVDGTTTTGAANHDVYCGSTWTFAAGGSMRYLEYLKFTLSGTLRLHTVWSYAATFADLSGNNNTMTPDFPTTSTDSDITGTITSLGAITQAVVTETSATGANNPITTGPSHSSSGWSVPSFAVPILGDLINDLLAASSTPPQFFYYPIVVFILILVSLAAYKYSFSLMIKFATNLALIIFICALNIYPWLTVPLLTIWNLTILLHSQRGAM